MKTNKSLSEDNLSKLFGEIPFEEPSADFTDRLLLRIDKEILLEKRKQRWVLAGQIAAGILGIFILPALTVYLCTIFLPGFSFSFPKIHFDLNPNLMVIGLAVLLLLIADTLVRMRTLNRTKSDS